MSRSKPGSTLIALPVWAWLVVFVLVPLGVVAAYSIGYQPDLFRGVVNGHLSLGSYTQATSGSFLGTYWNTLRIGVIGTGLCIVIGIPVAYWLAVKVRPRYRGLLIALVLVTFWSSFLVRTLGLQITLSPTGFLSSFLQWAHLSGGPLAILSTRAAVQLGVVYNYLPLMILPLYLAFTRADPALREVARQLGAGRLRAFVSVTMPKAFPGLVAGSLLVFVPMMGDYVTATLLGGSQADMAGPMVAGQLDPTQNWALGGAMAFVLLGFTLATVLVAAVVVLVARTAVRRSRRVDVAKALA